MTLLPPNATPLERGFEAAVQVPPLPVRLREIWDTDTCPEHVLPWLAYALSIDTWSAAWPVAVKRERIRTAIDIQRRKGTAKSVRDVVAVFGGQIALREWWQQVPPAAPFTFEINLNLNDGSGQPATAAYIDTVIEEVRRTKPVRAHFEFIQGLNVTASLGFKAVARTAVYARLSLQAAS